jgi:hypothetical protein
MSVKQLNSMPDILSDGVTASYQKEDGKLVSVFSVTNIGYTVFVGNKIVFLSDEYEQIQDWIMTDLGLLN